MTLHDGLTSVAALICIIVLILCARPVLRFLGQRRCRSGSARDGLMLAEQLVLDRTRRLSVIRYGACEVLLLTGGTQDLMMEWPRNEGFEVAVLDVVEDDVR